MALILGIESTCDETAVAIVRDGHEVLAHCVASSADLHKLYGGVFPEIACRRHSDVILPLIAESFEQARISPQEVDAIGVANRPGLVGALLVGLHAAKGLALAWNKPLIAVNHIEAHLYAAMMGRNVPFPTLGMVLSGGHTMMLVIRSVGDYQMISSTVDDAIGEAFDKVATLLGLAYPGGAALEKLAQKGDEQKYSFTLPRVKKNPLAFSFSGLKTAVRMAKQKAPSSDDPDIAAAFQRVACNDIVRKACIALEHHPCHAIVLGGGVSNNQYLRRLLMQKCPKYPLFVPPDGLSSDNGVMIAALAHHSLQTGRTASLDLEALPNASDFS